MKKLTEKRIATFGTFDLLHSGHFNLIKSALDLGSLYVGVVPDEDVLNYKNKLPIFNERERQNNLSLINGVNKAEIISRDKNARKKWLIHNKVTIVVMGGDHKNHMHLNELCDELSIDYVVLDRTEKISSSELISIINKKRY